MKKAARRFVFLGLAVLLFSASAHAERGRFFQRFMADDTTPQSTISVNGVERTYITVNARKPADKGKQPLVIVLHGGGGNAANAIKMTGFAALAKKEGFIAVFPNGAGRNGKRILTWNAGHCCGYAMENKTDDVAFISALIDHLVQTANADPDRVFVTGMSNGAMMTHRLAREIPAKIKGIAPVVGGLFGDETLPSGGVPALIINGAQDTHIPPAGGALGGKISSRASDGTLFKPTQYQSDFWARANGCDLSNPQTSANGLITKITYQCPPALPVTQYIIEDGTHAWPGGQKGSAMGDTPSNAMDATNIIWDFFSRR